MHFQLSRHELSQYCADEISCNFPHKNRWRRISQAQQNNNLISPTLQGAVPNKKRKNVPEELPFKMIHDLDKLIVDSSHSSNSFYRLPKEWQLFLIFQSWKYSIPLKSLIVLSSRHSEVMTMKKLNCEY